MATMTEEAPTALGIRTADAPPVVVPCPVNVTERAATEVQRAIADYKAGGESADGELYLRLRVQGGGCSGFQNKLDLDPTFNENISRTSRWLRRGFRTSIQA